MASPFASQPLVVDTKASLIRQRLADAIINGELKPGDRLVLDEIARELGVSKIPLREALSSLVGEGLVVSTPHSGPRVAPLPLHEIRGIYLLRESIESLAMQLAVEQFSDGDLDELAAVNDRMRTRLGRADAAELSDLNTEFHLGIARGAGYQTIVESVEELMTKIRRYRAVLRGFPADWERAVDEHDAVIVALRARDVDAAVEAMRSHVHHQGELEAAEATANDADAGA